MGIRYTRVGINASFIIIVIFEVVIIIDNNNNYNHIITLLQSSLGHMSVILNNAFKRLVRSTETKQ